VDYSGFSFIVPVTAIIRLSADFPDIAGCPFCWDSVTVYGIIHKDSLAAFELAQFTKSSLHATWHPLRLVGKAMTLQGPFRDLVHIKTPFMEGYGWEMMQEEPHRYHYELTDDGGMVTLMVWARHDSDALKGIENVVASIRPIEQKPER